MEKKPKGNSGLYFETVNNVSLLFGLSPDDSAAGRWRSAPLEQAVSVSFNGPWRGELFLLLYGQLLEEMAAKMLAAEHPSESQEKDVIKELANIICGNILPRALKAARGWRLEPPVARLVKMSSPWPLLAEARIPYFGGVVEVSLHGHRSAA